MAIFFCLSPKSNWFWVWHFQPSLMINIVVFLVTMFCCCCKEVVLSCALRVNYNTDNTTQHLAMFKGETITWKTGDYYHYLSFFCDLILKWPCLLEIEKPVQAHICILIILLLLYWDWEYLVDKQGPIGFIIICSLML